MEVHDAAPVKLYTVRRMFGNVMNVTLSKSFYTNANQICNLCEGRLTPVNSGSNCLYVHPG